MEKGNVHYIVFYNDNTLKILSSLDMQFRNDVKLIIKRTFLRYSRGQGMYQYFKNQILDSDNNIVESNDFSWNNLKCKIVKDERWDSIELNSRVTSVVLDLEIVDHLGQKNLIRYNMSRKDIFEKIKNDLSTIDRVGTHRGFVEIVRLENKISELEKKLNK